MIISDKMAIIYKRETGEIVAWGDEWQDYGLLGYSCDKFEEAEKIYGKIIIPYNSDLKGNERNSKIVNDTELVISSGRAIVE